MGHKQFKNRKYIRCVLCFETHTALLSPHVSSATRFSSFENEEYSSCFVFSDVHIFRTKNAYLDAFGLSCFRTPISTIYVERFSVLTLWERRIFIVFCALGHWYSMSVSRAIHGSHALRTKNIHRFALWGISIAYLSLEPFTGRMSLSLACKYICSSPIARLVNHCFTTRTGRTGYTVQVEVLSY